MFMVINEVRRLIGVGAAEGERDEVERGGS